MRSVRTTSLCALLAVGLLAPRPAGAYGWMIRHGYTSCTPCHADPSGSGVLTPYGRAQGDILLQSHFGAAPQEASPAAGFLWNALQPPEWLLAGGEFRALALGTQIRGAPTTAALIPMQADLSAEAHLGRFRASATAGAVSSGGSAASLFGRLIAREYSLGEGFKDDAALLRAGRIDLPFGLRSIEHTLFVRQATRTDVNDTQQHGVAFAYTGELFRGEMMGILGNYQVSPDSHRERGYSGFAELTPTTHLAVGVSSLITHAADDLYLRAPNTRQAHGLFFRYSPNQLLVLMGEADLILQRPSGIPAQTGAATLLQADLEPWQGLHFIASAETFNPGDPGAAGTSLGGWLGLDWFFISHADLRLDLMERSMVVGNSRLGVFAYMAQGHIYF